MARYYFHLRDGETILDGEGIDLPDLVAERRSACDQHRNPWQHQSRSGVLVR
jgi:hypothetical protein